ncbi:biorientation of chromosomes in cell division protein 1-like 1 isoform X2 [Anoplophora glabripennis]|uniref:biorientation of chromosomes in cell division protein 1-like 1 isoform X2 n=1 Tax=Anoplophora glabripennis TaxID=217634 RepID=UPI000873A98F|nr:biorientation of chromosomes in cell division protein 1-like 1 isoform X2 [Anoplophora glabripennis]
MEIVTNSYMPGDPRLIEQLVYELKSQGIFDQFRKECIADVDTKPAYQNLRQRVEGSVTSFLQQQTWRPDMNKNQVREQLRKNIYESGYLETGVERIVDQVVNPKINTIFLPQVEDVVYRYLGIEKPNRLEVKKELKIDVSDLLPTDLEAISPESDTKDDSLIFNESVNSETKMEEDESPPFEPIDVQNSGIQHEENSVDSHLSGFSGLQSHDSNPCMEPKICQMDLSNQDSQVSQNSSDSRLSIITSEDNTKMEIREDSDSKLLRSSDSNSLMENPLKVETSFDSNSLVKDDVTKAADEIDSNSDNNMFDDKNLKKQEDEREVDKASDSAKKKQVDEKQGEDRKYNERKSDDKKNRSSEKYSSKDKKDDKYKKSSGSSSREKEKSSSKYSSSSSSKDKSKSRDRKESKSSSSSNKEKDKNGKNEKDKDKNERDKDKNDKDKDRNEREKEKDKKDKCEKEKSDKSKSVKEKEKSSKDKDKPKSSSSSSNSSSTSKNNTKEKDKTSSSSKSDSSKRDKEKSRLSSSSSSKDKLKSNHSDSKSKSSDKHRRDDKSAHSKHSSSSTSSKKDKDKKKDSKKDVKDDHYSSKDKKSDRRSTDRDSNDGRSGRQAQANSFTESSSSQGQKTNQESSNSNSGSGSGDSGTSDQNEHTIKSPIKTVEHGDTKEFTSCLDTQKFKYLKPKFASNFQEARKLMKIRKQLAKLERHNQLSLAQIEIPTEMPMVNGVNCAEKDISDTEDKNIDEVNRESQIAEITVCKTPPKDNSLQLQSRELSQENWEALEARLAQEMSNINYNSYESPYDDYDYGGCNSVSTSPKKLSLDTREKLRKAENVGKISETKLNKPENQISKVICVMLPQIDIGSKLQEMDVGTKAIEKDNASESVGSTTVEDSTNEENKDDKNCLVEETIGVHQDVAENNPSDTKTGKIERKEPLEIDTGITEMNVDPEDKIDNAVNTHYSDSEPCIYLEPLSPRLDKNLQFLYRYIEKLEQDVKHSLKTFQNNFVPLKERYGKRKLAENVDLRNNNKAHYEQTTDISPNDSFSLPLSPAESDKSNGKKEDESPKPKQKRETGKSLNTRSQRYSSEDLYKPRPIFMSSRRSRGANNLGK